MSQDPHWKVVWNQMVGGSEHLPAERAEALEALDDAIQAWHLDVFESYCGPYEDVVRRLREAVARVRGLGVPKVEVWNFITRSMKPDRLFPWETVEFDPYNPRHIMALLREVAAGVGYIQKAQELDPNGTYYFGNTYQKKQADLQARRARVVRIVAECLLGTSTAAEEEIAKHLPGDHPHPKRAYQHPTRPRWRKWEDDNDWIRDDGVKLARTDYGSGSTSDDVWLAHASWKAGIYGSRTVGCLKDLTLEQAMDKLDSQHPRGSSGYRDIWALNVPVESWA